MPSSVPSSDPDRGDARRRAPADVDYGELPELTGALRAFGSARRAGGGNKGDLHAQFFRPLLEARRKAADARSAAARVHAFDARILSNALDRALSLIVQSWPDARASVRRAVRAELHERVAGYVRALRLLSERASLVLAADDASKLDAWRAWTGQVAATFEAADRAWMAVQSVVASLPSGG
jgi:hypothetical protein